jgi:hypothetical protein
MIAAHRKWRREGRMSGEVELVGRAPPVTRAVPLNDREGMKDQARDSAAEESPGIMRRFGARAA